jgi:hypothetical protein
MADEETKREVKEEVNQKAKHRKIFTIGCVVIILVFVIIYMINNMQQAQPKIGEIIRFGDYEWRVLDIQGDYALILTENVIGHLEYKMRQRHLDDMLPEGDMRGIFLIDTWENSSIRQYLNDVFISDFSDADRALIRETYVVNNGNPWVFNERLVDNDTRDKIFLLSIEEVVYYFGGSDLLELGKDESNRDGSIKGLLDYRIWEDNDVSDARISRNTTGSALWWWLRSPGMYNRSSAAYINYDGGIVVSGADATYFVGVRPALWLNLKPEN